MLAGYQKKKKRNQKKKHVAQKRGEKKKTEKWQRERKTTCFLKTETTQDDGKRKIEEANAVTSTRK